MKNPTSLACGPLLSVVAAASLLACHPAASAFSLGRMTVQSTLGEPLRAEIDVTALTPEEASTLRSGLASTEAFRAAGVDFNAMLVGAKATLLRRDDGRAVIRLVGEKAVSEPFVDVILDFSWSGGRLQRSYTLLIDPPPTRAAASEAPVAAAPTFSSASPAKPAAQPTPTAPAVVARPAPVSPVKPAREPAPQPRSLEASGGDSYRVRTGDTLSSIAAAKAESGVSLDQMLVGLFRGNPDAFIGANMNRLKSGVVLAVPDAQTASAVSSTEARQIIQAHSADFSSFRKHLAEAAPAVRETEPARQGSGKLEAAVSDRKPGASAKPDQLTLSKPTVKPADPEAKLSKETERKAAEVRVAELSRNVDELKKLTASAPVAKAAVASAPAVGIKAEVMPMPAPVVASAPAVSAVASAPLAASEPVAPASAPAKKRKPVPVPVAPPPEPSFLDSITDNPFVLPGLVGLVALAAGLGLMRLRRRGEESVGETSFVESKLHADSFFGVSGGQRVDTRDGGGASSSLSYSLSQLDAIGDVDPVAEADVYLAYGRDLQAEEILKEALRSDPSRAAIRTKLMEVYVKRADTKNAEAVALQLLELTGGVGEDWDRAQELGRQVEPDNGLYLQSAPSSTVDFDTSTEPPPDLQPMDEPAFEESASQLSVPSGFDALNEVPQTAAPAVVPQPSDRGPDSSTFDLDLDLASLPSVTGFASSASLTSTQGLLDQLPDLPEADNPDDEDTKRGSLEWAPDSVDELPELSVPGVNEAGAGASEPQYTSPSEFDFGDLSLDLDSTSAPTEPRFDASGVAGSDAALPLPDMSFELEAEDGDPLLRKIELADEFRRIGDVEGARDLLEEVLSKANDGLRARAQAMLNELG